MQSLNQTDSFSQHVISLELAKAKNLRENFYYSCSHGLRSPLKSIAGLLALLKDCPAEKKEDRLFYLTLIKDSITKSQGILNQFEEYVKGSKGDPVDQLIDLRMLVNSVLKEFHDIIRTEKIKVSTLINQRGEFYSDRKRLHMILSRLVSNAVAFHDPAKVDKEISILVTASTGGCSIQVNDNGIGIHENETKNIFNLFYRGSVRSNGTGIGLYIVREVLLKLKGTISVFSKEGEGSVFSLWLPNHVS